MTDHKLLVKTTYTDPDGNNYALVPYPYNKGDHACVGCAFKYGNSSACKAAPTCTPRDRAGPDYTPLVKGRHVWRLHLATAKTTDANA